MATLIFTAFGDYFIT